MPRVSLNEWLKAVMSIHGPQEQLDRHLAHVLGTFMRGAGESGCFPAQRLLTVAVGVNRRTLVKAVDRMIDCSWLEIEERRTQYNRTGYLYFPAVPLERLVQPKSAPIGNGIGAHQRYTNPARSLNSASRLVHSTQGLVHSGGLLVHPRSAPESLTEVLTEGAASPSPAVASEAARSRKAPVPPSDQDITAKISTLIASGADDTQIIKILPQYGLTLERVRAVRQEAP